MYSAPSGPILNPYGLLTAPSALRLRMVLSCAAAARNGAARVEVMKRRRSILKGHCKPSRPRPRGARTISEYDERRALYPSPSLRVHRHLPLHFSATDHGP